MRKLLILYEIGLETGEKKWKKKRKKRLLLLIVHILLARRRAHNRQLLDRLEQQFTQIAEEEIQAGRFVRANRLRHSHSLLLLAVLVVLGLHSLVGRKLV